MALHRRLFFILTGFVLVAVSCTKPVLIGSDFLDDEKASLKFEDQFELTFHTEETDSVIVHSENVSLQLFNYLLGNVVVDPIFGSYTAEIYAQPVLVGGATDLINSTFDSVVLLLRYDTLGNYGSINDPVTIEVYRMVENPDFSKDYYSDHRFMTDPDVLGSVTFVPHPFDSITVTHSGDTVRLAPHIRVPLSILKMSGLLAQDSAVFTYQDSFLNYFNGLHIKMTDATNTMIGIDLVNPVSGLSIFYEKAGVHKEFRYLFSTGSIKTVYMEHDYTGSFAEPSLGPDPETDYWFVQGLSGLTTRMKIENPELIGNAIINQAELDVYCSFPGGDVPHLYPPIDFLVTQEFTDTSLIYSLDVLKALDRVNFDFTAPGYKLLFGGTLEEVVPGPVAIYKYSMKVTDQVKDIFQGKKENVIYFNPFEKANVPNRSVMFGPGHPEYAPRLRVYYTAL